MALSTIGFIRSLDIVTARILVALLLATISAACGTTEPVIQERDSSAPWTKHTTTFEAKKFTFELPPGGIFNPEPNTVPFKFGKGSLGGVTYGQRPQGRELAALRVALEIRKSVQNNPESLQDPAKFSRWADESLVNAWLSIKKSSQVSADNRIWHYQVLRSKADSTISSFNYYLPLSDTTFLHVYAELWPSYAKSEANTARAGEIVDRLLQSIRIEDLGPK